MGGILDRTGADTQNQARRSEQAMRRKGQFPAVISWLATKRAQEPTEALMGMLVKVRKTSLALISAFFVPRCRHNFD